jgi:hypothetical protein
MRSKATFLALLGLLVSVGGCATRSDYETYARAERDDLAGALVAAREAQGGGIDGILFGTGASRCRDYEAVVTVLVAQRDFSGARSACRDYDERCAVVPDNQLCFTYGTGELADASGNQALADELSAYARQALHFRWLMIRDDYENRPPRRPIY